jgi:hypothetical protein
MFNYDGSDDWHTMPVGEHECGIFIDTERSWTGYELTEKEMLETIRCPFCKKYPFKNNEIHVYDIVRIVCFKDTSELDEELDEIMNS